MEECIHLEKMTLVNLVFLIMQVTSFPCLVCLLFIFCIISNELLFIQGIKF